MKTNRAQYIRDHYSLRQDLDGEWVARSRHSGINEQTGEPWYLNDEIRGTDRSDVARRARANWGHFNFEDEIVEFCKIFTR